MRPAEELTPPPDTDATGDAIHAYDKVWQYVMADVEYCARDKARDRTERLDLIEDARVALMYMDPTCCDIRSLDDLQLLRRMLRNYITREVGNRRRKEKTQPEMLSLDDVKGMV